ncbi:hypothetical protein AAFZ03_12640, partial [Klebsiella pneumoniae]|uniref:hypothetical protein n=1 Tax=Klebsiella pneumoniae TaxID=573 RepID=UPI00313C3E28
DKLLKSFVFAAARAASCAYYAFPLQSQAFIFAFLCEVLTGTPLTRRLVCRCSVSVEAHYRE